MNGIRGLFLILIFLSILCVPSMAASNKELNEADILTHVQHLETAAVPTMGSAPIGSQESMTEYTNYLHDCLYSLRSMMNRILGIFGQDEVTWNLTEGVKAPAEAPPTPPVNSAPVTYAYPSILPLSPGLHTFDSITGQSGYQRTVVPVYYDHWEVWYTVNPRVSEEGFSHSLSPSFNIVITDLGSGEKIATLEPPGGLDASSWHQSDPRPWSRQFSGGDDKVYTFDITAHDVRSYVIEIRGRSST